MIQFYCYSRCSTCRKAKQFLSEQNISFVEKEIKDNDLTADDIKQLHEKSGLPLKSMFNTSGLVYRNLNLKERFDTLTHAEAYELLASDGMLLKRPILISPTNALFGFKEADYLAFVNHGE